MLKEIALFFYLVQWWGALEDGSSSGEGMGRVGASSRLVVVCFIGEPAKNISFGKLKYFICASSKQQSSLRTLNNVDWINCTLNLLKY